jgi:hypothetical protein
MFHHTRTYEKSQWRHLRGIPQNGAMQQNYFENAQKRGEKVRSWYGEACRIGHIVENSVIFSSQFSKKQGDPN